MKKIASIIIIVVLALAVTGQSLYSKTKLEKLVFEAYHSEVSFINITIKKIQQLIKDDLEEHNRENELIISQKNGELIRSRQMLFVFAVQNDLTNDDKYRLQDEQINRFIILTTKYLSSDNLEEKRGISKEMAKYFK